MTNLLSSLDSSSALDLYDTPLHHTFLERIEPCQYAKTQAITRPRFSAAITEVTFQMDVSRGKALKTDGIDNMYMDFPRTCH